MTTKPLFAALLLALCGCADAPRDTGPGTVREAYWENHTGRINIIFEFQDGKTVSWESCGQAPLWKGEQVKNVRYQWQGEIKQCFDIYEVAR